jgi:hypothetical protein
LINEYCEDDDISLIVDNILFAKNIDRIADDFYLALTDKKYKSSCYVGDINCSRMIRQLDKITNFKIKNIIIDVFSEFELEKLSTKISRYIDYARKGIILGSGITMILSAPAFLKGSIFAGPVIIGTGSVFIFVTVTPKIYKGISSLFN